MKFVIDTLNVCAGLIYPVAIGFTIFLINRMWKRKNGKPEINITE